ncbi:MAG: tocopherol cyclase family protein [Ignavibacteriales bacterium]
MVKPDTCYGYADKNWGGDFTSPWVWLSSNNLTSKRTGQKLKNSVFNIGGGRPKVLGVALDRKLLSDFWYEGKSYEFNFSKFWTVARTEFKGEETDSEILWHVRQETLSAVMETEIRCFKKDMLNINYEAPNGKKLHNRLWNGGNGTGIIKLYKKAGGKLELIDEVEARNVGCEYGEYCD